MWNATASYLMQQSDFDGQETNDTDGILDYYEIDTTKYSFPDEIWTMKPAWEIIVKLATIIPVAFFGILGNSSLIYVILRTRSLKTTTNLLVTNMAFADLGTLLMCPWMLLCADFFQNYILGSIGCHIEGFLSNTLTLVAVFSLSAVSYDRVSAIVLNCSGKLSRGAVYALICVIWLAGITIAFPITFLRHYRTRQWVDRLESYCTEDHDRLTSYWNIFVGFSVCAPLAIMAVCYSVILIKLDKYETLTLKSKHPIAVKYKGKVASILGLVVVAFIICRVPYTVFIVQQRKLFQGVIARETMHQLWYASRFLLLFNAAVDPVLYGCTSSSLRRALSSCPTIAWILRSRKINCTQRCTTMNCARKCDVNWESMPNKRGILVPRSPYFYPDNQQEPIPNIPNISSMFKPINYSPRILNTINKI